MVIGTVTVVLSTCVVTLVLGVLADMLVLVVGTVLVGTMVLELGATVMVVSCIVVVEVVGLLVMAEAVVRIVEVVDGATPLRIASTTFFRSSAVKSFETDTGITFPYSEMSMPMNWQYFIQIGAHQSDNVFKNCSKFKFLLLFYFHQFA